MIGGAPLDRDLQRRLLQHARAAVAAALRGGPIPTLDGPPLLRQPTGVFVTWRRADHALRGCIGVVEAREALADGVALMAVAAALEDPRFLPVTSTELPTLVAQISVLSGFEPIRPDEVEVGRHGLMIRSGGHRGLLLPQVPVEEGWDRETFLEGLCRKANLTKGAWREADAELLAFTATVFGDERES